MRTGTLIQPTPGHPLPLGVTARETGTNFALFSRHATRVWLMLFDQATVGTPSCEFELDPAVNRTGDTWHIHLSGVGHGQLYLYRMDGPYLPEEGHRFNRHKPLLDPYTRALTSNFAWDFSQSFGYEPASPGVDLSFRPRPIWPGCPSVSSMGTTALIGKATGRLIALSTKPSSMRRTSAA